MKPTKAQLRRLRDRCAAVAAEDTCYPPEADDWAYSDDPLFGHCGAVALAVQSEFGGRVLSAREDGVRWIFNELPDGRRVSLSVPGMRAPDGRATESRLTNPRFRLFMERLGRRKR